MKKVALLIVFTAFIAGSALAEKAAATFRTDKGEKIQVIINNKVINHQPKSIVKVQGGGGLLNVQIKVYNNHNTLTLRDRLDIKPGFKSDFVIIKTGRNAEIQKSATKRIYNNHYRRPEELYNKKYFALISEEGMNTLMNRMERAHNDQDRLLTARNNIGDKKITTYDLGEILTSLEEEESKLKFAKWAYKRTLDQNNYADIHTAFKFRTSIIELDRFIYG
ncbi:DUF4476 domain-containing protein [Fulvivirga maritima]|uniref:DUF4476 domain-containing protein n=1 Tax=Fulvivirga maritima TaxID=2904247 RepID=UPI001F2CC3CD|nr:DUF4476 domain-containing protein [Fulvivirga maritima]UII28081.1 DUF4476 domain-containing protein [Fulvivirga maritima]